MLFSFIFLKPSNIAAIPALSSEPNTNVIATLKGNRSGKKILFSSHMDTVSPSIGVKPIIDEANGIIIPSKIYTYIYFRFFRTICQFFHQ